MTLSEFFLDEISQCIWRASYIHGYPYQKTGQILNLYLKSRRGLMASYRCEVPLTHKKIPSPMTCDLGIFRFISIHTINELIIIGTAQEVKAQVL
jgi:hypothetical protein